MRVEWDARLPAELRADLEPRLERWRWLLPGWLERLVVGWDPDHPGEAATLCNEQYRVAWVNLRVGYLGQADDERENTLVHELAHVVTAPLHHVFCRLVEGEDEFRTKTYDHALECAVSDLTAALLREWRRT